MSRASVWREVNVDGPVVGFADTTRLAVWIKFVGTHERYDQIDVTKL